MTMPCQTNCFKPRAHCPRPSAGIWYEFGLGENARSALGPSKPPRRWDLQDGKDSVLKIMFMENRLLFSGPFHRSMDWSLLGEGKWLRPASGRCSPWLVTGRKKGFSGNSNQQNYLSTMERGKMEIGAEILLRISREFAKSVEWLLTGER